MAVVLMFHGVGPVCRAVNEEEQAGWIEPDFFEAILDLAPAHSELSFTVDDGNVTDFTHVAPALTKRGLRATFFVCSGRLGRPGFLDRSQVAALSSQGMAIGSHGVDHVPWRGLSPERLESEIVTSRSVLEEVCGTPVDEVACPFGSYDRKVLAALKRVGYRRVYTSDDGLCRSGDWLVSRICVTREMSIEDIRSLIESDPLSLRQTIIRLKTLVKRLR